MGLLGRHDAAWWEAKADKQISEGRLSSATLSRWAEQESRELASDIRAEARLRGVDPATLSPLDIGMRFDPATGATLDGGYEAGF